MKIVIIGATGYIGNGIVKEALARGHQVRAIARDVYGMPTHENLQTLALNVFEKKKLADALKEQDVVISAFSGFHKVVSIEDAKTLHITGITSIIESSKLANISRLIFVGGAGSLKVAKDLDLLDTPEFPVEWLENAKSTRDALALLKNEKVLAWTFLSPSALIKPGVRTGKFRLGKDELIVDAQGKSEISIEDYAVAMIDEAESPRHIRQRFTVGY